MEIKRNGSQPSNKGPADWFAGTVRVDPLFLAHDPARASGAYVTLLAAMILPFALTASASAFAQTGVAESLEIRRNGSQPSAKGPADYFTGAVRVDPLFQPGAPSRMSGGSVTFEPGAHSAWHTHPFGQILIVTSGVGWMQRWGSPRQEIRPGDVIRIPPGAKHWHGATATTAMTHIALQEDLDGRAVDWMEKVSDEQYGR